MSCLNNDGYGCHFGNGKCEIFCNNDSVGIAFLKQDLYLLSLRECVNFVCDVIDNVSSSVVSKKKKEENSRCIVEIMALSFRPYFEGENRKTSEE